MARTDNLTNFLTDVASAIKEKRGDTTPIPAEDFDTEITNLPGADIDWTQLGYSVGTPQEIINGYNYAKQIKDNWVKPRDMGSLYYRDRKLMFFPMVDTSGIDYINGCFSNCTSLIKIANIDVSSATDMGNFFNTCSSLREIPDLDMRNNVNMYMFAINCFALEKVGNINTHSVDSFFRAFYGCDALTTIPVFDFSSATNFSDMFNGCTKLSDQSADNLLQSCLTATSYQGTKTLYSFGLNNSRLSSARVKACPHYQDFLDAGWAIGY